MKSSPTRRGPKPNPDTRRKLVQAGLAKIHADGYAATGIQSIVESAAVPKGSFYNHFASKEAFAAEVIDAYFERSRDKLRSIVGRSEIPALERFKAYFDDLIDTFRANGFAKGCLFGNTSAEVADHSAMVRERLTEQFGAWDKSFEACIAQAQKQGAVGKRLTYKKPH